MKNSSTFKIQIIFIGHLRGTDNLDSISNFFDNIDLNIINQRLNTSYSKIEYVYTLYTYPEINFKSNILNFGKEPKHKDHTNDSQIMRQRFPPRRRWSVDIPSNRNPSPSPPQ